MGRAPMQKLESPRFSISTPGAHPTVGRVNTYFISVLLLHPVISYILPKPWRTYWQAGTIGLEGWQDWYNASKGIGIDFHF